MTFRTVSLGVVLLAVFIYVLLELCSPIKPEYRTLPDLPSLEQNRKLLYAEHLFQDEWVGPESMTLDPEKKMMYTGLMDGRIVRWDGKSSKYEVFARTGEVLPNCGEREVEHICGRPLGLHFDASGNLIVADAYKGLLSIDPKGKITTLVTSVEGKPLVFTNDLAIASDGTIYFTDSSIYQRRDFLVDLLETRGHGRLLAYYPDGTAKVLLKDLYFPNGVTFHHDNESILIAELNKFRVLRYYPATGKVEVFADNLFGSPDNIRRREGADGKSSYFIGMGIKRSLPMSFMQMIGPLPPLRSLLALIPPKIVLGTMAPYGLLAELDENGKLLTSYQDPTGKTAWLSEGIEWDGYIYLGSFRNPFLARIPVQVAAQAE